MTREWETKGIHWSKVQAEYKETLFPHEDSPAVEQVAQEGGAISVLGGLQDQTGLQRWPRFEHKIGLETSRGPFQPELSHNLVNLNVECKICPRDQIGCHGRRYFSWTTRTHNKMHSPPPIWISNSANISLGLLRKMKTINAGKTLAAPKLISP